MDEKENLFCKYILTRGIRIHCKCNNNTENGASFCDKHLFLLVKRNSLLVDEKDLKRFEKLQRGSAV